MMKNYFYTYINYTQDNWVDNLLIAEFVANNHVNVFAKVTLFFANYRFHLYTGLELSSTYNAEQKVELLVID